MTDAQISKEMQAHHYPLMFEVEESHWWYVGRRKIISTLVEKIFSTRGSESRRILDVGCGTGANLKMLQLHGSVEGVEISEQAVEMCRQRGLESVRLGAIEDLPYEDESFDLVTALDVLEHLDDDAVGLRELRRVLRPGGTLLVFVPAFMFLWGSQDDASNHRRRYTLPQLRQVLRNTGFEIEKDSYANFTFFVPVLLVRTFMRWLGLKAATEYPINIKQINGPLSWLFAIERFVLTRSRFPFGVSVMAIARRANDI